MLFFIKFLNIQLLIRMQNMKAAHFELIESLPRALNIELIKK